MKIGFIGIGVMGKSMAKHLQDAGHDLYIYSRTRSKAADLEQHGAIWCDHPAAVAAHTHVVFTIVGFPQDVETTYLGQNGILTGQPACRIVVDMTTSQPALAKRIHTAAAQLGIGSIDAPVSGGDTGARNATLAIMCGGDQHTYDEILPLLNIMGGNIALMGPAGSGQHTKMCNQILIAGTMIGVCESLLYAQRQGMDQQDIIDIIGKGAAGSWSINNLGPRIAADNYDPGFFVEHFVKDMGIALDEAAAANLCLPGLALVHQLYISLKAQGRGRLGTQSLILALKTLNGAD